MQPKLPMCSQAPRFRRVSEKFTSRLPVPRCGLFGAAAALGLAVGIGAPSPANGSEITYSLVNYPSAEKDIIAGHVGNQDSLSGTVTAISSGTLLGTYTAGDNSPGGPNSVEMNFTVTVGAQPGSGQPSITYTDDTTLGSILGSGTVTFTGSSMTLNSGYLTINGYDASSNFGTTIWRSDSGDLFQGEVDLDETGTYPGAETEFSDSNALTDIGPSPWTIATVVPEASPLALLAFPVSVFLLGRRRFRSAGN